MRTLFFIIAMAVAVNAADMPNTFTAGSAAKANEVNENFTFLLNQFSALKAELDSVKAASALKDNALQVTINGTSEGESMPIGTVVGSMLDETAFQEVTGDVWVLADGRISSTEYFSVTGIANIPDLRGQFLRGMNAGASVDPDTRNIASIQNFSTARPINPFSTNVGGEHTHSVPLGGTLNTANWAGGAHTEEATSTPSGAGGIHSHTVSFGGDVETRPTNVALYWYIKIK